MGDEIALVNPGIRRHRIPLFSGLAMKLGNKIDFLITDFDGFLRLEHLTMEDLRFLSDNRTKFYKFQSKKPLANMRVSVKLYFHLLSHKYEVIVWASSEHFLWPLLLIKSAIPWKPRILLWTSRWKATDFKLSKIHEKVNLRILNASDIVICASQPSMNYYIERGFDRGKLRLIQEGSSNDHREVLVSSFTRKSGTVIGYIGQLIQRKGVDILIRAFAEASRSNSDATLVIAGEGNEKQELEKLAGSLVCRDKTVFLGFVQSAWSFFKSVDIIVYPTRFDPQGLVVAEALSAGVPVVTTYAAGLHYYVHDKENGLVVEPNSQDSLDKALSTYLSSPALRSKLKKGALLTARNHPIDKMVDDFLTLLSQLRDRSNHTIQE